MSHRRKNVRAYDPDIRYIDVDEKMLERFKDSLPYLGSMDIVVKELVDDKYTYLSQASVFDERNILVIDADRAAAVSATAEGAAGLHRTLDHLIAKFGEARRSDYKG